jgi:hypothetical protein
MEGSHLKKSFFKLQLQKKDGLIDPRRMQDHYKSLSRSVYKDICTGNQSGKEGEESEVYKLVEQLRTESDQAEALENEVKKDGVDLQDRLNETVDTVLNGKKNKANKNTAVKIKKADGTVHPKVAT